MVGTIPIIYFIKVKIIKNLLNLWIFMAKFDLLDLDPCIEYGSGYKRRFEYLRIHPDREHFFYFLLKNTRLESFYVHLSPH